METENSISDKRVFVRDKTEAEIKNEKLIGGCFFLGLASVMAVISYWLWLNSSNEVDVITAIFVALSCIPIFWRGLSYLLSQSTTESIRVTLEIDNRSITYNGARIPWTVVSSIKLVDLPSGGTNLVLFKKNENDGDPDKPRAVVPGIHLYEQMDEIMELIQEKAKQPIVRESV